jgi:hypothetical protein
MNMLKFTRPIFAMMLMAIATLSLSAQGVFYTEDFDGAIPSDWTNVEVVGNGMAFSTWVWTDAAPTGPFGIDALASSTAANGFVLFDSDSNCNHPGGQDAWLISPEFDCSDKDVVFLKIETFYRSFNDRPAIMVGTDLNDLESWTEFEVFPNVQANQWGDLSNNGSTNPQIVNINLTDAMANEPSVYFAIRFHSSSETINGGDLTGCGYSWMVDDISLSDEDPRPPHDMRVNPFFAVAQNLFVPLDQVEPVHFLADIENIGSQDQTNVNLNVDVVDEGSTSVYSADLSYGTIETDSLAENQLVPGAGFLPTETGVYTATYTVSADSTDENMDNNTRSFAFAVTDTLFGKENGSIGGIYPAASNWDAGENRSWAFGNYYYVKEANGNYFRYVSFAIQGTNNNAGDLLSIKVYEWTDDNIDGQADPDERDDIMTTLYTIQGDEDPTQLITLPLLDLATQEQAALSDDTEYLVVVEYIAEGETEVRIGGSDAVDYTAMIFNTAENFEPRYALVLGVNGDLESEPYSTLGFGQDLVPAVRVSVGGPFTNDVSEALPANNLTRVFPNPAVADVTLDLEFTRPMDEVQVQMVDINGKVLGVRTLQGVQQTQLTYDVSSLAAGIYYFQITSDAGTRVETFMVQH